MGKMNAIKINRMHQISVSWNIINTVSFSRCKMWYESNKILLSKRMIFGKGSLQEEQLSLKISNVSRFKTQKT
jgi:hypothetical protein